MAHQWKLRDRVVPTYPEGMADNLSGEVVEVNGDYLRVKLDGALGYRWFFVGHVRPEPIRQPVRLEGAAALTPGSRWILRDEDGDTEVEYKFPGCTCDHEECGTNPLGPVFHFKVLSGPHAGVAWGVRRPDLRPIPARPDPREPAPVAMRAPGRESGWWAALQAPRPASPPTPDVADALDAYLAALRHHDGQANTSSLRRAPDPVVLLRPVRPASPSTLDVLEGVERWRLASPGGRRADTSTFGHVVFATIFVGLEAARTIKFVHAFPADRVVVALDGLANRPPGTRPVVMGLDEIDREFGGIE